MYPIPEAQLRNRIGHRPRDVLEWCQQFQERCVAAKRIIEVDDADAEAPLPVISLPPIPPLPQQLQHPASQQTAPPQTAPEPPRPPPPIDRIASAWNDTLEGSRVKVLDDDDVLALVEAAAHAYAEETGISLTLAYKDSFLRLKQVSGGQQADLVIGVTNRSPRAGAFGIQIKKLRQAARGAIAIAVRTDEFPTGAKSVEVVEDLRGAGGRAICLDKRTLRALLAHKSFQPAFSAEHIQAWRHSKRPIASLQSIAEIFGLDSLGAEAPSRGWPSGTARPASSAAAG